MFRPDDPFAPYGPAFEEPWQAQALALAEAMVQAGQFSAGDWAEGLGEALRDAEARGEPDTSATYYLAVVEAVERLSATKAGISAAARQRRKHEWEDAYFHTPHGQPVVLG